jgi:hypothetical protein
MQVLNLPRRIRKLLQSSKHQFDRKAARNLKLVASKPKGAWTDPSPIPLCNKETPRPAVKAWSYALSVNQFCSPVRDRDQDSDVAYFVVKVVAHERLQSNDNDDFSQRRSDFAFVGLPALKCPTAVAIHFCTLRPRFLLDSMHGFPIYLYVLESCVHQ